MSLPKQASIKFFFFSFHAYIPGPFAWAKLEHPQEQHDPLLPFLCLSSTN